MGTDFNGNDVEATFTGMFRSEATACADIFITDDDAVEGDESFSVLLSSVDSDSVTIANLSAAMVTIVDDDGTAL